MCCTLLAVGITKMGQTDYVNHSWDSEYVYKATRDVEHYERQSICLF